MNDDQAMAVMARASRFASLLDNRQGEELLEDLESLFTSRLFHTGPDGARRTDFALGSLAVLDHIRAQIKIARHGLLANTSTLPGSDA